MSLNIIVVGAGYVGLVSAAGLASLKHHVWCVDVDHDRIAQLQQQHIPFYEPNLPELVHTATASGHLKFMRVDDDWPQQIDVALVCVGTPMVDAGPEMGAANLSFIDAAYDMLIERLPRGVVMATKSTVPVGTAQRLRHMFLEKLADKSLTIASNPEFLREGQAVNDFLKPNRIVIGADDTWSKQCLEKMYAPLVGVPQVVCSSASAELTKLANNAFLAARVAMINQLADLAEVAGANIDDVAKGIGLDQRIGNAFLSASPAYGGSCFPKDLRSISYQAKQLGVDASIIATIDAANRKRAESWADRVLHILPHRPNRCQIGMLGLAFKAHTDDVRESVAMIVAQQLLAKGHGVIAFDPQANHTARKVLPQLELVGRADDVFKGVDAVLMMTEWPMFKDLPFHHLKSVMRQPLIVDLRRILPAHIVRDAGIEYRSLGDETGTLHHNKESH